MPLLRRRLAPLFLLSLLSLPLIHSANPHGHNIPESANPAIRKGTLEFRGQAREYATVEHRKGVLGKRTKGAGRVAEAGAHERRAAGKFALADEQAGWARDEYEKGTEVIQNGATTAGGKADMVRGATSLTAPEQTLSGASLASGVRATEDEASAGGAFRTAAADSDKATDAASSSLHSGIDAGEHAAKAHGDAAVANAAGAGAAAAKGTASAREAQGASLDAQTESARGEARSSGLGEKVAGAGEVNHAGAAAALRNEGGGVAREMPFAETGRAQAAVDAAEVDAARNGRVAAEEAAKVGKAGRDLADDKRAESLARQGAERERNLAREARDDARMSGGDGVSDDIVAAGAGGIGTDTSDASRKVAEDRRKVASLEGRIAADRQRDRAAHRAEHSAEDRAQKEKKDAREDLSRSGDDLVKAKSLDTTAHTESANADAAGAKAEAVRASVHRDEMHVQTDRDKVQELEARVREAMRHESEAETRAKGDAASAKQATKQHEATVTVKREAEEAAEAAARGSGSASSGSGAGAGSGSGSGMKGIKDDNEARRMGMTAQKVEAKADGLAATEQSEETAARRDVDDLDRYRTEASEAKAELERARAKLRVDEEALSSDTAKQNAETAEEEREERAAEHDRDEAQELEGKAQDLRRQSEEHESMARESTAQEIEARDEADTAERSLREDESALTQAEQKLKRDADELKAAREAEATASHASASDARQAQRAATEADAHEDAANADADSADVHKADAGRDALALDTATAAETTAEAERAVTDHELASAEAWLDDSKSRRDALRKRLTSIESAAAMEASGAAADGADATKKAAERDASVREARAKLEEAEQAHTRAEKAVESMRRSRRVEDGANKDKAKEKSVSEEESRRGKIDGDSAVGLNGGVVSETATGVDGEVNAGAQGGASIADEGAGAAEGAAGRTQDVNAVADANDAATSNLEGAVEEGLGREGANNAGQTYASGPSGAPSTSSGGPPPSTGGGGDTSAGPSSDNSPPTGQSSDTWQIPPEAASAARASGAVTYTGAPAWSAGGCRGGPTPGVNALKAFLMQEFAGKIQSIGGYSCRQNTANKSKMSVHGTGRAMDIMIKVAGAGKADSGKGDPVANYLLSNAGKIGVQYIIWNRYSWNQARMNGKRYGGPNPHIDHLHVEITEEASRKSGKWW